MSSAWKVFNLFLIFCTIFCTAWAQNQQIAEGLSHTTSTTARPGRHRIVGGIETRRNEYPFIVSFFRNSRLAGHFCGGSIIDRHWVITAAHCMVRPDFNITAGEHDLTTAEGTEQTTQAVKVILHPKYNRATFENDIALVKVFPPFNYTDHVKHFQLPSVHFVAAGNVTAAGWGVVLEGRSDVSPVLRKVTIGVFPNLECAKSYGKDFHVDKMICAGNQNGGKDACQGDSGGPLLCEDVRFGDTLCGIVSYGMGCARQEFAGVYTKVAYYADWVAWEQKKDSNPNMPDPRFTTTTTSTTTRNPYLDTITARQPNLTEAAVTTTKGPRRRGPRDRKPSGSTIYSVSLSCVLFSALCAISFTFLTN